jgi:hypothetical protein
MDFKVPEGYLLVMSTFPSGTMSETSPILEQAMMIPWRDYYKS